MYRWAFYGSLIPYVRKLISSGFTGKSKKYAIDRIGNRVYIALIENGRPGEWVHIIFNHGKIIKGK